MNFASDNWAGAHPAIAESLNRIMNSYETAYGGSETDRRAEASFAEAFQCELDIFPVASGTMANSLSMAIAQKPGGVAFCHEISHMMIDECGAPEFLSGGGRLRGVGGPTGKIDPDLLESAIAEYPVEFLHHGRPVAVSITQATDQGALYTPAQIREISAVCRKHGLLLHMDGARFANAVSALQVEPSEITHAAGVDIMSFGGTKNGRWCAEAVVLFRRDLASEFRFLHKRAGQLFSKSRFVSAQWLAYFENGLWLTLAGHANRMAARLAERIEATDGMRLAWQPEANEVFAIFDSAWIAESQASGALFHPWSFVSDPRPVMSGHEQLARLVTNFATTEEEIERFMALAE